MMKRFAYAISSLALAFSAFATPALADTDLQVTGNGSSSNNTASVDNNQTTTVVQNNTANISNTVDSKASTGGNTADNNTGGDVVIDTGNATSRVDVSTRANLNRVDASSCNGCPTNTNVNISGNGAYSESQAKVSQQNNTSVFQDNYADIRNYVDATAKTGGNSADRNTGGDVTIVTGHANTEARVRNEANANIARLGGTDSTTSTINATITGNGAYSNNSIRLNQRRSATLVQDNNAYVDNYVDIHALTGWNRANDNTNGNVVIDTGNAVARAEVDNRVNFNAAVLDCCLFDTSAKISGNGAFSHNRIYDRSGNVLSVFQGGNNEDGDGNNAYLANYLSPFAKTGRNSASRDTSTDPRDPVQIITGHAEDGARVTNKSNVNLFGPGADLTLPEFHFDMGEVLGFIGGH